MNLNDKTTRTLILAFGSLLFSYTLARAYLLSFTWDESYTYLEFVRHSFWIPSVVNNMTANDHLLNTWLMKISAGLFGNSEFSLRIPNLIAHLLYLFFSIQLVKIFDNNFHKLLAFVLLNFNPYVLDFFSAARGYGLSMGLMMASLYFLLSFFAKEKKFIPALLAILTSLLALLANLTLFPFFLIESLILIFFLFLDLIKKRDRLQLILQPSILIMIVVESIRLLLPYTLKLKEAGALFFGGTDNYFNDTLVSLMLSSLYERMYLKPLAFVLAGFALLLILISMVMIIRRLIKKEFIKKDIFFISILILTLSCILAAIVQHYFMDTRFPMQRTGLYLLPLFGILLTFLFSNMKKSSINKIFSGLIMAFVMINFISTLNLRSLANWKEEAEIKNALNILSQEHSPAFLNRYNITIGTGILFDPPINYYRVKNNLSWLNLADYSDSGERCDYYLADEISKTKIKHAHLIGTFSNELFLYKNDQQMNETILLEKKVDFENLSEADKGSRGISKIIHHSGNYAAVTDTIWQYSLGVDQVIADSMIGNDITVSMNAMVFAPENNFEGRAVISFEHSDGTIYSWKAMDIRDQVSSAGMWTKINYTRFANYELKARDHLKIYIWNYGKSPIYMDDLEIRMLVSKKE